MKQSILILFMLLTLWPAAKSEEPSRSKFINSATSLHRLKNNEYGAVWVGRLLVTGKLAVEYNRTNKFPPGSGGSIAFEPDANSQSLLPQAIGKYYPSEVTHVWLKKGPEDVLPKLIGHKQASFILNGNNSRYEIPVRIMLKYFEATIECEHRVYAMEYEYIDLINTKITANGEAKNFDC